MHLQVTSTITSCAGQEEVGDPQLYTLTIKFQGRNGVRGCIPSTCQSDQTQIYRNRACWRIQPEDCVEGYERDFERGRQGGCPEPLLLCIVALSRDPSPDCVATMVGACCLFSGIAISVSVDFGLT